MIVRASHSAIGLTCVLASTLFAPICQAQTTFELPPKVTWAKLNTEAYKGKQDDIHFLNANFGYYVNGSGKIYKTIDGGKNWTLKLSQPGTYFRAIGVIDEQTVVAGNIGVDYYPNVTDSNPLYISHDSGEHWEVAGPITGPKAQGICAIDVLRNGTGQTVIRAAGRVGGPAFLLRSNDLGKNWSSTDLSASIATIQDVKFLDDMHGFVFGASDSDTEKSHAKIIATNDGGKTWKTVYESSRPFELTWKASFPTAKVAYATIQNYDENKDNSIRYVAKTTDGGNTWTEVPLVDDHAVREFGVGFINETTGWVGTISTGFQTTDGGKTWTKVDMGRAVNKIRIVPREKDFVGYAIGVDVYKFEPPASSEAKQ